ncbi:thiazole tautomerase TenI [Fredinandcohnia quinoae]|uniref:Thiazole tautomerase TenI n=1 Tax=Fredinandcohnia quinoae TaxID=2918902 RepID=A0AAW5E2E5_9BACI|nr:thiazole tautomerase TenI [Fredinandcohnia sp. SECRCQ15]MCH1627075.1 thiazole tautomerase TenI [Fredinandcohnia sp. SECRCQ15]
MAKKELHIISTGKQSIEKFVKIAGQIHEYADYFHIREKHLNARQLSEVIDLLTVKGVPLSKIIVNDRVDVAVIQGISGVQLAYHSLDVKVVKQFFPRLKVGKSTHSNQEVKSAYESGADFGLFGHIFTTTSKPGLEPKGIVELATISKNTSLPIIAIGGIKPNHVRDVIQAGASGIAIMSGVLEANNPLQAVKEYACELEGGSK